MFDSISGRLERREPARVVVRAGGIGYEVHVPLSTYEALPAKDGEVGLLVHLVVREDEWRLYGFSTAQERAAFRALLRVTGVGPTTALALLSGLRPAELADAVARGAWKTLTRVKGVGRKTAERIVVELRDVLAADGAGTGPASDLEPGARGDAAAALVALGLDAAEARRRVEAAAKASAPDATVATLVRHALRST